MENLFGKLAVSIDPDLSDGNDSLVEEINRVINPPRRVTAEQIHLGVLHAASTDVNLQGGCFAEVELRRLAELVVDTPVMVGHKKQELPIGRIFKGEVVHRDDQPWLKAWFFWHRDQEGADSLKAGIESGIFKECSLGFLYGKPECAICREDMRHCRHRIGEAVHLGGKAIRAFFYYKEIQKILEISLVYRGAVEGTSISTLSEGEVGPAGESFDPFRRSHAEVVFDLRSIASPLKELLIEPLYRGIWLDVKIADGRIAAAAEDGNDFSHPLVDELKEKFQARQAELLCQFLPMKGSSRLPLKQYLRRSETEARAASSILLVFDVFTLDGDDLSGQSPLERKKTIARILTRSARVAPAPYRHTDFLELTGKLDQKGTAEGMLIIDLLGDGKGRIFEYRRRKVIKGSVVRDGEGEGKRKMRVRIGRTLYPLQSQGESLKEGMVIWAAPSDSSRNSLQLVDICPPGSKPDSLEIAASFVDHRWPSTFHLLRDISGGSWLKLRHDEAELLFRIDQLGLRLLDQGRRFWCEQVPAGNGGRTRIAGLYLLDSGQLHRCNIRTSGRIELHLCGSELNGNYLIEQTGNAGSKRCLFSQLKKETANQDGIIVKGETGAI